MARLSKRPVIVFHETGLEHLSPLVLDGLEYVVFDPQKDLKWSVRAILRAAYDWLTGRYCRKKSRGVNFSLRSIVRRIRSSVIANQLRELDPCSIISFNDNSALMHGVCEAAEDLHFIGIQNGGRYVWCARDNIDDHGQKFFLDDYFCFGPQVKRLFQKYGHCIRAYHCCGSLIGGSYFTGHRTVRGIKKKYDLCFISQWHEHFYEDPSKLPVPMRSLPQIWNTLTQWIARYQQDRVLRLCIALRFSDAKERKYYTDRINAPLVFVERLVAGKTTFNSYEAVSQSEVTVCLNSTLGSEAFGAGYKVLFNNPSGEEWLESTDFKGVWNLVNNTFETFKTRIDQLLTMDLIEYQSLAAGAIADTMSYDEARPPHSQIHKLLMSRANGA